MATKVLRVTLDDILGSVGPDSGVTGEVWARYVDAAGARIIRYTDGTLVLPLPRRVPIPAGGVVDLTVVPSDDATVHADDQGFGVEVGWSVKVRGEHGRPTTIEGSRVVQVVTADSSPVAFGLRAPMVPVIPGTTYVTAGDVASEYAPLTDSDSRPVSRRNTNVLNAKDYGAKGDGSTSDTTALTNLFAAAKAARVTDSGTNKRPGAKVIIPPGTYMLTGLSAPLEVCSDVEAQGAVFVVPAAYAGVALLVGAPESGGYLVSADITLPDVVKASGSAIVAGSEAVRVMNLGNSRVKFGKAAYFERGYRFTGDAQGTAYNQFFLGWVIACKVSLSLKPHTASGWANQNTFVGGGVQQSVSYAGGTRLAGWHHVELDGSAGQYVNGNTFVGVSFEGDVSQYWLKATTAANNVFTGCRYELGTVGAASTVSGDTITTTAHGLAVGDMVAFGASSAPGGMVVANPYFVVSVPTADTFKVAVAKGGTAITFSSAGSGVNLFRPPTVWLTGSTTINNVIRDPFTPMGFMEIIQPATAAGNVMTTGQHQHAEKYDPGDVPIYAGRNGNASGSPVRPVFAAYAPTVSPVEDPLGWSIAISDRGVLFAASRAEVGRLYNNAGILQYQRPADSAPYEIASVRRAGSPVAISGLSLAAGATTTQTITLTGASVNDYATAVPDADLPSGVAIAWVRVSATNTVKIGFLNITASPISLTVNVQVMATRRYY